jgi:hypothetical protein
VSIEHVIYICFFNSKNKIEIDNIKNLCISHISFLHIELEEVIRRNFLKLSLEENSVFTFFLITIGYISLY